jgi:uncharacterized protein (TIGR00255 family)
MINSMTAFARAEKSANNITAAVEIRSYNSRHLDIALRVPHGYDPLESKIRTLVSGGIARGRLEIRLLVTDDGERAEGFDVNESRALAYHDALNTLKELLQIKEPISLEMIARSNDVLRPAEEEQNLETQWPVIEDSFQQAIADLKQMRQKEGDFLARDLKQRIDLIQENITQIENESGNLLSQYQDRLIERISALTKGIVEIDQGRIAQEAAFLADRSDISEEITRAGSHVQQFLELMNAPEPAGRKLNFLLQELNREFNTMGSKVGNADISHQIVSVKSEFEKIREQVQNVE